MNSLTETTSRIGDTLIVLQKLEALLRATMLYNADDSNPDLKLRRLLQRDRQTMGMLLKHMAERVNLPPNYTATLDQLLNDRNIFVHKLFLQDWFDLKSDIGIKRLNQFITTLLEQASFAVQVFIGYALALGSDKNSSLSDEEAKMFDGIIRSIFSTANPEFGDKSPEEYFHLFEAKVRHDYAPNIKRIT